MELESQTPTCSLIPDDKHGMLMCMKMWQVRTHSYMICMFIDSPYLLLGLVFFTVATEINLEIQAPDNKHVNDI